MLKGINKKPLPTASELAEENALQCSRSYVEHRSHLKIHRHDLQHCAPCQAAGIQELSFISIVATNRRGNIKEKERDVDGFFKSLFFISVQGSKCLIFVWSSEINISHL